MATIINHIAVNVLDLNRSTSFYKDVLGLPSIPEPFKIGKHSWFQIDPRCQLHLIQGAKEVNTHHINNHLAFSVEDIEEFINRLNERGIKYWDAFGHEYTVQVRPDGIKQVFFQDPDGYWLEINNDCPPETE